MRSFVAALVLAAGCGRLGFDAARTDDSGMPDTASDADVDSGISFVEPTGTLDMSFGSAATPSSAAPHKTLARST